MRGEGMGAIPTDGLVLVERGSAVGASAGGAAAAGGSAAGGAAAGAAGGCC